MQTFLSEKDILEIVQSIKNAESQTSGEIRLYIHEGELVDSSLKKAEEVFTEHEMHLTAQRNAVLLLLAPDVHKLALYGDKGIHDIVGLEYWEKLTSELLSFFREDNVVPGIIKCIDTLGQTLGLYYPGNDEKNNELPDDILFGNS